MFQISPLQSRKMIFIERLEIFFGHYKSGGSIRAILQNRREHVWQGAALQPRAVSVGKIGYKMNLAT